MSHLQYIETWTTLCYSVFIPFNSCRLRHSEWPN